MNPDETIDARIWDYIDGHSSPAERADLEALLQASPIWQERFTQLQELQAQLLQLPPEQPSMRFSKNVTEAILQATLPSPQRLINKRVVGGIAALLVLLFIAGLVQGMVIWGTGPAAGTGQQLSSLSYEKALDALTGNKLLGVAGAALVTALLLLADALVRYRWRMRAISAGA